MPPYEVVIVRAVVTFTNRELNPHSFTRFQISFLRTLRSLTATICRAPRIIREYVQRMGTCFMTLFVSRRRF